MITKDCIAEIEAAARIEEVVADFVPLKKAGKDWIGICPFHDDKNPSMHVSPRLGIYKCFVCGAAGGPIHFVMEHEKSSYPDALRYLAAKYHIEIKEDKRKLTPEEQAANDEREALLNVTAYAEKYFVDQLFNSDEGREIGLTYFQERGFREETIRKFRLGYCPEGWDKFTTKAMEDGYKLDYLLETGLTKKSENGRLHDFYHGRVIFPIQNGIGKPVGFGGRILAKTKTDKIAKYFNSPESIIYHKSDILYGFFFAKKSIRTSDNVYLVEGYTDVISMSESGVENVVASSGTALTEGQIRLIKAQTKNITVLYDGDAAGIKASLRGINMLLAAGLNVKACLLPDGEDPDSFAKQHRDSELRDYLTEHTVSIIQFKADILMKEAGNDPLKRAAVVNDILGSIAEINDDIIRSFYVRECADLFNISEESLNANLRQLVWKKINDARRQPSFQSQPNSQNPIVSQGTTPPTILQPDESQQLPKVATPTLTQPKVEVNHLDLVEFDVIHLLLKCGMYETHISQTDEEGNTVICPIRVDQYIFNELHDEEIVFQNPLYQQVYEEYAVVAQKAESQEDLEHAFVVHENEKIRNLAVSILMEEEPEYSEQWEKRFELHTDNITNSVQSLNTELSGCINLFKLRLVERHKKLLLNELGYDHTDEEQRQIMQRLVELDKLRKKLADLLGMVISQSDDSVN